MANPKSRVRWTEAEKRAVAGEWLAVRQANPKMANLQVVLKAQAVLPAARQRQILAWTVVKDQLEPHIAELRGARGGEPQTVATVPPGPAEDSTATLETDTASGAGSAVDRASAGDADGPEVARAANGAASDQRRDGGPGAGQARVDQPLVDVAAAASADESRLPADEASAAALKRSMSSAPAEPQSVSVVPQRDDRDVTQTSPAALALARAVELQFQSLAELAARSIEQALLGALSSQAVREQLAALAEGVVDRTASRLLDRLAHQLSQAQLPDSQTEKRSATEAPAAAPTLRPKVLVIGLEPAHANELTDALSDKMDVRYWRPGESADQLKAQARICSVAVIVSEDSQPQLEALLKPAHVRIIRHSAGVKRLRERLKELLDSGVFNLLT